MRQLASRALATGQPLAWYEQLYAAADVERVPWDHGEPTPYLVEWLDDRYPVGQSRGRAVVVGCAYGDDAELTAAHGFEVTAFDIAASAIQEAQVRHSESRVHYRQADLLDLPDDLVGAFDLVIECTTLQCLPPDLHARAAVGVASLCAPGGTILVVARIPTADARPGPPWLLTEDEVRRVATGDVRMDRIDRVPMRGGDRWVGEFSVPFVP